MTTTPSAERNRIFTILIGAALAATMLALPAPGDMPVAAWRVAAVALLMATWWITEAIPIPATSLLPLVLFPLLGINALRDAAAPYADPIIFLFLGGFVIATAMQRWSLHRRIGLSVVALVGVTSRRLSGGLLLATAFLSMWISNSATAIIMLPVAISVLALLEGAHSDLSETARRNLKIALLLSVAYGASIGGLATLIGTPANALLAAYLAREQGIVIGFAQWMLLGLPLTVLLLGAVWLLLNWLYPVGREIGGSAGHFVTDELAKLGPMSRAEIRVAVVFVLTALAWMLRPLYGAMIPALDDALIALIGALALFLLPSGMPDQSRLLAWEDTKGLPWDVLILFGSGLSLAAAISASGLAQWLGQSMQMLAGLPAIWLVAAATVTMLFLTELTSNTASAATFIPITGAIAAGIGLDPLLMTLPLALAASCAFMMPVATPPNAIVFASGQVTIAQMARAGIWVNLIAAVLIMAICYPLGAVLFR